MSVHYFKSAGVLSRAKGVVRVASVVGLIALAIVFFQARQKWGELVKIDYGGVGTLAGFVVALYGSLFLED